MHRHYIHPETSVSCNVVVMTQDIGGLHRSPKNVIEFAFKLHKHKAFGLSSRHRVEIYKGSKLTAKARTDQRQKKYDPAGIPAISVQNGTPLNVLQELSGWQSAEMIRRYAHFSVSHLAPLPLGCLI